MSQNLKMASSVKTIKSSFTIENLLARPHQRVELTQENVERFNEFQSFRTFSDRSDESFPKSDELIKRSKIKSPESSFSDDNVDTSSDGMDDCGGKKKK